MHDANRAAHREGQPAEVPVAQLTTYELRKLREKLEEVLAMDALPPYARPRDELEQELADAIAEQDERARIANARA